MPGTHSDVDQSVRKFWDKYIILLGNNGIKPGQQRWYVRRVEAYIYHYTDQKLATHTPDHVTQYFHVLGRQKRLKDWQFQQAVRAIQTLFCDFIRAEWAATFDWQHWIDSARELESDHATIARESGHSSSTVVPETRNRSLIATIKQQHPVWVEKTITEIRKRDYSIRTEQVYLDWVCRFVAYHKGVTDLTADHIVTYLEHLAIVRNVAASTQNQALNALVFFYKNILDQQIDDIGEFTRARRPKRLPVVLSRDEVKAVLSGMSGTHRLMTSLLYGAGLRLMECVRLRVMDIDFSYKHIKNS